MLSIRDEYETHGDRQRLTVWTGAFASQFVAEVLELPGHNGYMITHHRQKVRVECPSPRTDSNYIEVDKALTSALEKELV